MNIDEHIVLYSRLVLRSVLGTVPADAAPLDYVHLHARVRKELAACGVFALLSRLLGWSTPSDTAEVRRGLETILPGGWVIADFRPNEAASHAALALVRHLMITPMDLSDYYERVLASETFGERLSGHRRLLGAFHTPQRLADLSVLRVLAGDPETDLSALTVADLAVGVGRFPVAWATEAARRRNIALIDPITGRSGAGAIDERWVSDLLSSLHLTDVDAVALELAMLNVASRFGEAGLALLGDGMHAYLGNALLVSDEPWRQRRVLSDGHIWHPAAGVLEPHPPVDVVIGNPPWERVRFEEKQLDRSFGVSGMNRSGKYRELVASRRESMALAQREIRADPRFSLASSGELYSHVLFTALGHALTERSRGRSVQVIKSAMLSSPGHAPLTRALLDAGEVREVNDFVNTKRIFQIDSRERFAVLVLDHAYGEPVRFRSGMVSAESLANEEGFTVVDDATRNALSPTHRILPAVGGAALSQLKAFSSLPPLGRSFPERNYGRLLHLTNHRAELMRRPSADSLPVWEGRMIEQYTSRFATWSEHRTPETSTFVAERLAVQPGDRTLQPLSRWSVRGEFWQRLRKRHPEPFSVVWRNASAPTNRRTVIATLLPTLPTTQSLQLVQHPDPERLALMLGLFNSLPFDWLVRQRMPGIDVTGTLLDSTPTPSRQGWDTVLVVEGRAASVASHIVDRVARLVSDDAKNDAFVAGLGTRSGPGTDTDRERAIDEIDALVITAYAASDHTDITSEFVPLILGSFPLYRRSIGDHRFARIEELVDEYSRSYAGAPKASIARENASLSFGR